MGKEENELLEYMINKMHKTFKFERLPNNDLLVTRIDWKKHKPLPNYDIKRPKPVKQSINISANSEIWGEWDKIKKKSV